MKLIFLYLFLVMFITNVNALSRTAVDEIAEQYVKLVLALGVHDSSYVDAYYGPKKWKIEAKNNAIDLEHIIKASENLLSLLDKQQAQLLSERLRLNYLTTQLSSLNAQAKILSGNAQFDFDAQSKALYDTTAPHFPMEKFDTILRRLSDLIPGEGNLAERSIRFAKQFDIHPSKLTAVFDAAIKECKKRTQAHIRLPENEDFKLEYVTNKPWSGYNWYKGNAFSLIQINTEHPISISRAIDLGCHEGYPGHHTYNALLEDNLVNAKGWVEFSVYPLFSPQSLIAEGSANYGIELTFPGKDKSSFERRVLFPLADIDPALVDQWETYNDLKSDLKYVGNELARLYLNKEIDRNKAIELLEKYTLVGSDKAAQRVDFWDKYGAYVINYNWGKDLVKQWVESGADISNDEKWRRFSKLLSSPRLPATLSWE